MSTLVTQEAPDFTAPAVMANNTIQEDFTLSAHRGKYILLFFWPMDFTFVCPTEIVAFNKRLKAFKERNCEIIGVSTDSQFTHFAWKHTKPEDGGIGNIQYPMVADLNKNISRDYGVLLNESIALRGLFLIDREGIVRHSLVNDLPLC